VLGAGCQAISAETVARHGSPKWLRVYAGARERGPDARGVSRDVHQISHCNGCNCALRTGAPIPPKPLAGPFSGVLNRLFRPFVRVRPGQIGEGAPAGQTMKAVRGAACHNSRRTGLSCFRYASTGYRVRGGRS
jgi:hypothetical protein